jgi:hypothetical protein
MKCREIEIYNRLLEQWDRVKVSAVFNLAVVSGVTFPRMEELGFYGINIGIAIPTGNKKRDDKFWEEYYDAEEKTIIELIYLIGEEGEKVPVRYQCGNIYDKNYGGSCLFCYVVPNIVAEDDRPDVLPGKKKSFGSYPAELNK